MRVLVTGGSGFIGSHVVDRLRAHGVTVRVFDTVLPTTRTDIEFYQGSILDLEALRGGLHSVDAVFHLAAVADVRRALAEPHYAEAINTRGTMNVLEACRVNGVKRVIYGSTSWIYSDVQADYVDETTPIPPPSHIYTATKLASEFYCQSFSRLYGLDCTILRYGIPYGPRAWSGTVFANFVPQALRGEPLAIQGDGSQFRQFVYVEDLAEGNVLALKPVAKNKIYNLDGIEKITIREIAEAVQRVVGDVEIRYTEARPGDFRGKIIASQRARAELGWQTEVGLEEGIRRYVAWCREQQQLRDGRWALVDGELSAPVGPSSSN